MNELKVIIEDVFENCDSISLLLVFDEVRDVVVQVIDLLNSGKGCVVEKIVGEWVVYQWFKKVVLFFFCFYNNDVIEGVESKFYDKVLFKYINYIVEQFVVDGVCIVLLVVVCMGIFVGKNVVVMFFYVNIGVFVDEGIMVDIWVIVGLCV